MQVVCSTINAGAALQCMYGKGWAVTATEVDMGSINGTEVVVQLGLEIH